MAKLPGVVYDFKFSNLIEPSRISPACFHSTLPVRVSRFVGQFQAASLDAWREWTEALEADQEDSQLRALYLTDSGDNFMSLLLPECPPELITPWTKFAQFGLCWHDAAKNLDEQSRNSALTDLLQNLDQKNQNFQFKINELWFDAFKDFTGTVGITDPCTHFSKLFKNIVTTKRTADLTVEMNFEEYKLLRGDYGEERLIISLVASYARISEEEQNSISSFVDKGILALALLNDLYDYQKAFRNDSKGATLDRISNTVVFLMSTYSRSEDDAVRILKTEICALEDAALHEYDTWQLSAVQRSDELQFYAALIMAAAGGMAYWKATFETDPATSANDGDIPVSYSSKNCIPRPPQNGALTNAQWTTQDGHQLMDTNDFSGSITNVAKTASKLSGNKAQISVTAEIDVFQTFRRAPSETMCMAPFEYTISSPSKGNLSRLVEGLRAWIPGLREESVKVIETAAMMVYHNLLMVDDVQDGSQTRRGMPAAYILYGTNQTMNSATYVWVKIFELMAQLKFADACRDILIDELKSLGLGQSLELHWRFHKLCPPISDYFVMVDNKSGSFFQLVMRLMSAESGNPAAPDTKLSHFINLLGRYYQIWNDYQNLESSEYMAMKGFCDDLSEGKLSIILIHTLQNSVAKDRIKGLMFHREPGIELSDELKSYILSEMKAAGSLDFTKHVALQLYDAMLETLTELEATMGENKLLRYILHAWKI
ncbi:geranylgeranyl pyrophosphate synthase [Blastomyces dermatitidis ER-3]|uniref:Geranylgeranyl pyrophosphate synthase n=1 Tax=Ajellomyces dermatitidis (strain ER-3 / ATCC MYA-2586) TaxID=559297 RepID=A0ABX2VS27_AJEDR|nr:geranylgeranyl pyrophosphate synthase [Blastomyces dermatitidis ER-3]EQL30063.1 hypothetical protein BDFG_07402 [Blastomyces dermatitidis ATCC 26199]OAT00017.1 geranylgeranyl pyrophosphate synthase [Blastomyces dermatitidis ER-3]